MEAIQKEVDDLICDDMRKDAEFKEKVITRLSSTEGMLKVIVENTKKAKHACFAMKAPTRSDISRSDVQIIRTR